MGVSYPVYFKITERQKTLKNEILQFEFLESAIEQFKSTVESKGTVNLSICNLLLDALAEASLVNEAKKLFLRMKSSGISPNEKSFCMLIKVYNKMHLPSNAEEMLNEMKRIGITPSTVAYSSVMDAYASSAQINQTEKLFNAMTNAGCHPNEYTYSALIKAYMNGKKYDKAETIFIQMMEQGMSISIVLFTQLLKCMFEQKQYQKVQSLITQVKKKGIHLDETCYRVLIRGYSEANMWNKFDDIVDELFSSLSTSPSKVLGIHTFHSILFAVCNAGKMEKAKLIFRTYFGLVGSYCKPSTWTFNIMIKGFVRLRKNFEADELYSLMIKNGIHPNMRTFHMLMQVHCENMKLDKAKTFLQTMKQFQLNPDSTSYNILIKGASECGYWNECKKIFEQMQQNGITPNEENDLALIYAAMQTYQWRVARDLAGKVFKSRLQKVLNSGSDIDLHGLDKSQAISVLLFILTHIRNIYEQRYVDLNIITGIGKHSQSKNYSNVRSQVISFLKHDAKLRIVYKPWNKGILIVQSSSLRHWIQNGGFETMMDALDRKCNKRNRP